MFENQLFDHWLQQKSQDILAKMDKEKVSTEDMLILTLKAQTNHFHHMDVEFRGEFKKIDQQLISIDTKLDRQVSYLEAKIDKNSERQYTAFMWGFGIIITSIFGLFLKISLA